MLDKRVQSSKVILPRLPLAALLLIVVLLVPTSLWGQTVLANDGDTVSANNRFMYSFAEDSNNNGRIDHIRIQADFDLMGKNDIGHTGLSAFQRFDVEVDGYTVDRSRGVRGYQRVQENTGSKDDADMLYIYLEEKPLADAGATPVWRITQNESLFDARTKLVLAGLPEHGSHPTSDTVPPRIDHAFTVPEHPEIFFRMSKPVQHGIVLVSSGALNTAARRTPVQDEREFLVIGSPLPKYPLNWAYSAYIGGHGWYDPANPENNITFETVSRDPAISAPPLPPIREWYHETNNANSDGYIVCPLWARHDREALESGDMVMQARLGSAFSRYEPSIVSVHENEPRIFGSVLPRYRSSAFNEQKADTAAHGNSSSRLDISPGSPVPNDWFRQVQPFSFQVDSVKRQRSGVTILNNVINVSIRERVFLEYYLVRGGRVTVQVFTLDGTLVKVLENSTQAASDAYPYRLEWNGTNNGGRPVARGMYFIRIVAPDIDEIRKVMVVH